MVGGLVRPNNTGRALLTMVRGLELRGEPGGLLKVPGTDDDTGVIIECGLRLRVASR